jgi:hypothetical protein
MVEVMELKFEAEFIEFMEFIFEVEFIKSQHGKQNCTFICQREYIIVEKEQVLFALSSKTLL